MSKVLITGGAGYIGSMLSTKLLSLGHKVTVVDLLKYDKGSLNHLYFNKNFELICEDVRKKSLMKKLVKKNDFIIPLAALVGAPLCEKFKKDPKQENQNLLESSLNMTFSLIDKAVKKNVLHKNNGANKKSKINKLVNSYLINK